MVGKDMEYTLYKEYRNDNSIVRVYRPVLTEEERKRRMDAIRRSAEAILKEQIKLGRG